MKRMTALILILAFALCLAACGLGTKTTDPVPGTDTQTTPDSQETLPVYTDPPVVAVTPTVVVTSYPVPSSTPEPTPTVAPTPTAAPIGDDGFAIPTALATEEERAHAYVAYVQGSGINVRAGVGTGTDIIDVVNIGDKVMVLGEESGWTKVIFHDKVGYIYSPFIDTAYPVVNNNNNAAAANNNVPNYDGTVTIIDPNGNATVVTDDSNSGTGVIIVG